MKKTGETLKKIRLAKNYSLEKASNGIMSHSYLLRIERGENNPTFAKVIKLLDRYNVSVEEFFFLKNNGKLSKKEELSRDIYQTYYSLSADKKERLKSIEERAHLLYQEEKDFYFLHISLLAKIFLKDKNLVLLESKINTIRQYFFSLENYTKYDFKLLINFIELLDTDATFTLMDKILRSYKKYEEFVGFSEEYIFLLLNLFALGIRENRFEQAYKFMTMSEKFLLKTPNVYAKMVLNHNKGLLLIKQGKRLEGLELIKKQILHLEHLEMFGHAALHKKDLENFLES